MLLDIVSFASSGCKAQIHGRVYKTRRWGMCVMVDSSRTSGLADLVEQLQARADLLSDGLLFVGLFPLWKDVPEP